MGQSLTHQAYKSEGRGLRLGVATATDSDPFALSLAAERHSFSAMSGDGLAGLEPLLELVGGSAGQRRRQPLGELSLQRAGSSSGERPALAQPLGQPPRRRSHSLALPSATAFPSRRERGTQADARDRGVSRAAA